MEDSVVMTEVSVEHEVMLVVVLPRGSRCCCFAAACLAEQARSPLMAINCLVPWGTEAIPRVRCSRPNCSEQKERWGRFDPTLFGVGVHPPRRGAPDVVAVVGTVGDRPCWILLFLSVELFLLVAILEFCE